MREGFCYYSSRFQEVPLTTILFLLAQAITQSDLPSPPPHITGAQGRAVVLKLSTDNCSGPVSVLGDQYRCRPDNAIIVGIPADAEPGAYTVTSPKGVVATLDVKETRFSVSHPKAIPPKPAPPGRLDQDENAKRTAYRARLDERWQSYHLRLPLWAAISERYRVSSPFGDQRFWGTSTTADPHNGTDLAPPQSDVWSIHGPSVLSMAPGVVVLARELWREGNAVIAYHGDNVYTSYSHLSDIAVKEGDLLSAGIPVGSVGGSGAHSSGPHLHLVMRIGTTDVDALESAATLNRELYMEAK